MITEIIVDDGEVRLLTYRAVAVEDYGSEGCMPVFIADCPLGSPVVACVAASGNSICGGYMGHAGEHVVRCQEPMKEKK